MSGKAKIDVKILKGQEGKISIQLRIDLTPYQRS